MVPVTANIEIHNRNTNNYLSIAITANINADDMQMKWLTILSTLQAVIMVKVRGFRKSMMMNGIPIIQVNKSRTAKVRMNIR